MQQTKWWRNKEHKDHVGDTTVKIIYTGSLNVTNIFNYIDFFTLYDSIIIDFKMEETCI
jgi:hypothetical protein